MHEVDETRVTSDVMYHLCSKFRWFLQFFKSQVTPERQRNGAITQFSLLVICSTSLHIILHHESNQLCETESLRKFHFCINFPSVLSQTKVVFASDFLTQIFYTFLVCTMRAMCQPISHC
jgi:hypothetical protein